jgi:MerR family transcriptional regulator, copper efflux regulator
VPLEQDGGASEVVPIACSLSGTDMAGRVDDWSRVLSGVVRRLPLSGGARLELSDRGQLAALAALVEVEQVCCPFFSFAITVDHRGLAVEVTAPTDGQDLLHAVFGDGA